MPHPLAHTGLPPGAYCDPKFLELEKEHLFRTHWQWAGLIDDLKNSGGIQTEIAGLPITVEGEPDDMRVHLRAGQYSQELYTAVAAACGRFVFVRLCLEGPGLEDFLGSYAELLRHCSDDFDEVYHAEAIDWECNWKPGLEVTLEGYHVPYVHAPKDEMEEVMIDGKKVMRKKKKNSNLAGMIPKEKPPTYMGPHSYIGGVMSKQMRDEMDNIARRLKIKQSRFYRNYDHFTLFPNMTVGFSGGNLCFIQIYTPLSVGRTRLRYAYIMAKLADPALKPVPLIKTTLLNKWREYTVSVLKEDQDACEMFQQGVPYAQRPAFIAYKAEQRVAHFHNHWRQAMKMEPISAQETKSAIIEGPFEINMYPAQKKKRAAAA